MRLHPFSVLVAGALLFAGSAPARAQLTASPESLWVVLVQGAEATHAVTISNGSTGSFPYCLDVLRPGQAHHAPGSLGAGCGPPGERIALRTSSAEFPVGDPLALTMTPDGRLFVADYVSRSTWEYDAALNYVRDFLHPRVAQLSPFVETVGVTYDARMGTLWWTNVESFGFEVRRTLLLEGTLSGAATGRRVQPQMPTGNPPAPYPVGGAFDPATARFYFLDVRGDSLWAVDSLGAVVPGYPLRLQRYPQGRVGDGLDVHGGESGASEVRLEVPVSLGAEAYWSRVVVTDAEGRDLGLETPIPAFPPGWRAGLYGTALRSRLDPNGVMYGAFSGRDASDELVVGLFAWRPVPLAPSWLALSTWRGGVEGGGSAEVSLTFRAGERAPGEYRATLVVEDAAGVVLASVPLTLVVEPGTPSEPGPAGAEGVRLSISPNPSRGRATVTLALGAPARVRLSVYDVLGREVAVLADGPLAAGAHTLPFDSSVLAPGLYLLRAEAGGHAVSRPLTVAER